MDFAKQKRGQIGHVHWPASVRFSLEFNSYHAPARDLCISRTSHENLYRSRSMINLASREVGAIISEPPQRMTSTEYAVGARQTWRRSCCKVIMLFKYTWRLLVVCPNVGSLGPVAQYHENSKYFRRQTCGYGNKEVDIHLPHITIELAVYKECLVQMMYVTF